MDFNSLESFKLELPELHCQIYVLVMEDGKALESGYAVSVEKLRRDIQDLRLVDESDFDSQKEGFEEIHSRLNECFENPAFTFLWDETEAVVVLKMEKLSSETPAGFFGTLVHELSHAITMLFESLGLKTDDDEHRSIVLGNLVEASFQHVFPDIDSSKEKERDPSRAERHV